MGVEKKRGLTPLFTEKQVEGDIDEFVQEKEDNEAQMLLFVGEGFINNCRNLRTYKDVTGNLRSSIGYVVAVDKEEIGGDLTGQNPVKGVAAEGRAKGNELANSLMTDKNATVLIGVAGMEYGMDVEARGKDVITGSAKKAKQQFNRLVKKI